jgi:hypothetical protein
VTIGYLGLGRGDTDVAAAELTDGARAARD